MTDTQSWPFFLHRVKERKTPSLSAQASFAPYSLQVAWSGKSLISKIYLYWKFPNPGCDLDMEVVLLF